MWTPHILCQPIWGVFTFRQDCSKTSCIEKLIEPEFTTKLNEWRSCMECIVSVVYGLALILASAFVLAFVLVFLFVLAFVLVFVLVLVLELYTLILLLVFVLYP